MARILIVDDEADVVLLLERILRGRGHDVSQARDGAEALQRAAADPPDLVLIDRNLPKIDGSEVCRRLRADDATRRIPVVMMASGYIPIEEVGGPNAPDAYIVRPFLREILVANVERLLSRA
jgi:DNA-binding response OmpR family regulator